MADGPQGGFGKTETLAAQTDTTSKIQTCDDLASQIVYQLASTWVGTVTFQCTLDGTNWLSVLAYPSTSTTGSATATANGVYRIDCSGYFGTRVNWTARTSGSITVTTNPVIG